MSVVASAKARLVGENGVLAPLFTGDLARVKVHYSAPNKDVPRELVYAGEVTGPVVLSAFAPAGGRARRQENLVLQLHVRVWLPNKSREENDARAIAIGDVIANYIAANWKLGDLPELIKATVDGVELSGWTDDEGSGSVLTLAVGLESYLT